MSRSNAPAADTQPQGGANEHAAPSPSKGFKRRLLDCRLKSAIDELHEEDPEYFQRALQRIILEIQSLQESIYGKPSVMASPDAIARLYGLNDEIEAARAAVMSSDMTGSAAGVTQADKRPYPDEYVVLVGERVEFHSASQREAMMRYAELLRNEEQDQAELRFLPARVPQRHEVSVEETTGAPQIRGRALAGRFERRR